MTTFRCPSDILITSWLFTARWSTWPFIPFPVQTSRRRYYFLDLPVRLSRPTNEQDLINKIKGFSPSVRLLQNLLIQYFENKRTNFNANLAQVVHRATVWNDQLWGSGGWSCCHSRPKIDLEAWRRHHSRPIFDRVATAVDTIVQAPVWSHNFHFWRKY